MGLCMWHAGLVHVCDRTSLYVWHDGICLCDKQMRSTSLYVCRTNKCRHVDRICLSHQQMRSCHTYKLVTWRHLLVCHSTLCDMACLYVAPRVWCDSLMCVTWLIHTCDLTAFICVTWLVYMCDMFWWLVEIFEMAMCDMTAFVCVTRLVKHPYESIHMCDTTRLEKAFVCVTWQHSYVWQNM